MKCGQRGGRQGIQKEQNYQDVICEWPPSEPAKFARALSCCNFLPSFSVEQGGECKQEADDSSSVSRSVSMTQDKEGHVREKKGKQYLALKR